MIDTIAITLPSNDYTITDPDKFVFSSYTGSSIYTKAVYNPNIKVEGYKPRLTRYKRGSGYDLKVEFSAPKLLLDNNFEELEESDLDRLLITLQAKLMEMGIRVFYHLLRNADISVIHFSKNFVFTNYITCSMILRELNKSDVSKRLDSNQRDYRNGGHCLHFHCNSFEIVFYDKMKDLQQAKTSEKRSIEKDNALQLSLFNEKSDKDPFEVLRMEIRIGNRTKLKQTLEKLNYNTPMTLEGVFKTSLAKTVLSHFWQEIRDGLDIVELGKKEFVDAFESIMIVNPDISITKILSITSALYMINKVGVRQFRKIIESRSSPKVWYRLKNNIINLNKSNKDKFGVLDNLTQAIKVFEPYKLSSKTPCNVKNSQVL